MGCYSYCYNDFYYMVFSAYSNPDVTSYIQLAVCSTINKGVKVMSSEYEQGELDFLLGTLDPENTSPKYWEGALAALSLNSIQFPDPVSGSLDVRPLEEHDDRQVISLCRRITVFEKIEASRVRFHVGGHLPPQDEDPESRDFRIPRGKSYPDWLNHLPGQAKPHSRLSATR